MGGKGTGVLKGTGVDVRVGKGVVVVVGICVGGKVGLRVSANGRAGLGTIVDVRNGTRPQPEISKLITKKQAAVLSFLVDIHLLRYHGGTLG